MTDNMVTQTVELAYISQIKQLRKEVMQLNDIIYKQQQFICELYKYKKRNDKAQ